jgi:hypothetical protein
LSLVPYFTEGIADSITFLRKDFRNDIGNELKNILKYNYRYVLIANTFTNLNRSFGGSNFDYQRIVNFKNKAFRISRNIIIID